MASPSSTNELLHDPAAPSLSVKFPLIEEISSSLGKLALFSISFPFHADHTNFYWVVRTIMLYVSEQREQKYTLE
jgi:hypothetical protein